MSLAHRIIPCLDTDGARVVKGVKFAGLRDAGDPAELAMTHGRAGADDRVAGRSGVRGHEGHAKAVPDHAVREQEAIDAGTRLYSVTVAGVEFAEELVLEEDGLARAVDVDNQVLAFARGDEIVRADVLGDDESRCGTGGWRGNS